MRLANWGPTMWISFKSMVYITKVTITNKTPKCFAPPFSTSEPYKINFPTLVFFRQTDTVPIGHFLALPL